MNGLIEGRIVHYVPGEMNGFAFPDEHRPAMIVKVWDRTGDTGCANLQVHTDGANDGKGKETGHFWATSVPFSEEPEPRTWHWIEVGPGAARPGPAQAEPHPPDPATFPAS